MGPEKLYYIDLAAPPGPQIPVYGEQTKIALRMIALNEKAGEGGAGLEPYLAGLQAAEDRVDIVRATWNEQVGDTIRLLEPLTLHGRARRNRESRFSGAAPPDI